MVFPALLDGEELCMAMLRELHIGAFEEAERARKDPQGAFHRAAGFLPTAVFSMMLVMCAVCARQFQEQVMPPLGNLAAHLACWLSKDSTTLTAEAPSPTPNAHK